MRKLLFHNVPAAPGHQEHRLLAQQLLCNPPLFTFFFFCFLLFIFLLGIIRVLVKLTFLLCRESFDSFLMCLSPPPLFCPFQVRIGSVRRRCCWKHTGGNKTRWKEQQKKSSVFFNNLFFFLFFFFNRFLSPLIVASQIAHNILLRRVGGNLVRVPT